MNDTLYGMQMEALPAEKRPESCIGCGACAAVCPQQIDIPAVMSEFSEMLANGPNWAELCRQREEAAERLRAEVAEKKYLQLCCVASDDHDAGSNRCEQENRDAFRPESISVCFDRDQMLRWTAFDRGRPVNT